MLSCIPLKFVKHGLSGVDLGGFRLNLEFIASFTTKYIYIAHTLEENLTEIVDPDHNSCSQELGKFEDEYE